MRSWPKPLGIWVLAWIAWAAQRSHLVVEAQEVATGVAVGAVGEVARAEGGMASMKEVTSLDFGVHAGLRGSKSRQLAL